MQRREPVLSLLYRHLEIAESITSKPCGTVAHTKHKAMLAEAEAKTKSKFGSAPDWTDSIFHTNGLKEEECPFLLYITCCSCKCYT